MIRRTTKAEQKKDRNESPKVGMRGIIVISVKFRTFEVDR